MARHRNPRARLPKRPTPDNLSPDPSPDPGPSLDDLLGALRDQLGKADAFISSAEYQMEQASAGISDEDELRRRGHVEHLVEAGRQSVRAAIGTTQAIALRIAQLARSS